MISLDGWIGVMSALGSELQRIVLDYNSNTDDKSRWVDRCYVCSRFGAKKNSSRL